MNLPKRILIVDDDVDILEAVKLTLEFSGYEVETLTKGEEVYSIIQLFKPNLILLDILLSGSDGRLVCQQIKQNSGTSSIPILIMSAHPEGRETFSAFGADEFIEKPFDVSFLLKRIKHYVP